MPVSLSSARPRAPPAGPRSSSTTATQHQSNDALLNPASGRYLDATGPSSANGTRLQIWHCTGSANQQWNLPADPTSVPPTPL